MTKKKISTIFERNKIANNIINAIIKRKSFLICGHENPDEDCISSMIAFAILLTKFDKPVQIYLDGYINPNLNYLLNICKYNSIRIINKKSTLKKDIDTIIICDTPKKEMLDISGKIKALFGKKGIIKIEIDHHIGADSGYIGDKKYSMVDEASSASELVGFIALKLRNKKDLLMRYFIRDPFSRNFILAILTGIVGDTDMGRFIKSRREKRYYWIFSNMYNEMLIKLTVRETNLNKIEDVSKALQRLTEQEEKCYNYIIRKKAFSRSFGYVFLNEKDMQVIKNNYDNDVLVTVVKHIADELAKESDRFSMIVYYDDHEENKLYQFRIRRSFNFKELDLRDILTIFKIENGGGHEGAIGFRFPVDSIDDVADYMSDIIKKIEDMID